jgi:hypothetical protein
MKILAGIPTRLRNTSGKIADVLAEVCDQVLIVSQGAVIEAHNVKDNIYVTEKDVNFGLVAARNCILDYAVWNGFDIVIQSDDDLAFKADVAEALIKEVVDNPHLGAIASSSRAYFRWNEEVGSNKNWVLNSCPAQFWAARTEILTEVGKWKLEFLEDRDHGARMWKCGYPIALLHTTLAQTHNPFIARTQKSESSGGQEQGEIRQQRLQKAIDTLNEEHGDIVTAKIQPIGSPRTFSTRYKWDRMIASVRERWHGSIGYSDEKGRSL